LINETGENGTLFGYTDNMKQIIIKHRDRSWTRLPPSHDRSPTSHDRRDSAVLRGSNGKVVTSKTPTKPLPPPFTKGGIIPIHITGAGEFKLKGKI
jgi:hypothetical protein